MALTNDLKFQLVRNAIQKLKDNQYHARADLFGNLFGAGEKSWQQKILRRLKDLGLLELQERKPGVFDVFYRVVPGKTLDEFDDDDALIGFLWPKHVQEMRTEPTTEEAQQEEPSQPSLMPFSIEGEITPELREKMLLSLAPNLVFIRDKILAIEATLEGLSQKVDRLYRELGGKE
jgi:hypothetical protein